MDIDIELIRWVWALLALVFLATGVFTRGFVLPSLGIGAGAAMAVAFLGPNLLWQLAIFVGISAISFMLFRPFSRRTNRPAETVYGTDRVIGKEAIVIVPIDPKSAQGRVRVEREDWPADSETGQLIPDGSTVQVLAVRDTRLLVRPLPNANQ
jgi:membrane protein implicated in regulation of membrane protease activity